MALPEDPLRDEPMRDEDPLDDCMLNPPMRDRLGHGERAAQPPFPSADEWLQLPLPQFDVEPTNADTGAPADAAIETFVDRALARLRDAGLVVPAATDRSAPLLTPQQRAQTAPPPPSADFVARTLQRVQHDRTAALRALLLRWETPTATPDFVERTLVALRRDVQRTPTRSPLRYPWRAFGLPLLAAAAMLWLLWPGGDTFALRPLATRAPALLATSHGPLLTSRVSGALDDSDGALAGGVFASGDAADLLFAAEGKR